MADKEKQVADVKNFSNGFLDQQMTMFGALAENAAQMAEVQKSVLGLATSCATNVIQSAMATQAEIARMSLDAMLHRDPVALMSLGKRAMRTGFEEGMDCAARNLRSAQSVGSHLLEGYSAPHSGQTGTH